eukprot:6212321-Pleurochrysis_carterae.AAC.2
MHAFRHARILRAGRSLWHRHDGQLQPNSNCDNDAAVELCLFAQSSHPCAALLSFAVLNISCLALLCKCCGDGGHETVLTRNTLAQNLGLQDHVDFDRRASYCHRSHPPVSFPRLCPAQARHGLLLCTTGPVKIKQASLLSGHQKCMEELGPII